MAKKNKKSKSRAQKTGSRKLLGKSTGKGIAETWVSAFAQATRGKWTDDKISRFMKSEFPGRSSAIFELPGVKAVRSRYNNGVLLGQNGKAPATRNVALGSDGKPAPRASAPKAKAKGKGKAKKAGRRVVVRRSSK